MTNIHTKCFVRIHAYSKTVKKKKLPAFLTWFMTYPASHLGWLVLHPSKLYSHKVPT